MYMPSRADGGLGQELVEPRARQHLGRGGAAAFVRALADVRKHERPGRRRAEVAPLAVESPALSSASQRSSAWDGSAPGGEPPGSQDSTRISPSRRKRETRWIGSATADLVVDQVEPVLIRSRSAVLLALRPSDEALVDLDRSTEPPRSGALSAGRARIVEAAPPLRARDGACGDSARSDPGGRGDDLIVYPDSKPHRRASAMQDRSRGERRRARQRADVLEVATLEHSGSCAATGGGSESRRPTRDGQVRAGPPRRDQRSLERPIERELSGGLELARGATGLRARRRRERQGLAVGSCCASSRVRAA